MTVTEKKPGWLARLGQGLARSSTALSDSLASVLTRRKPDAETLDELEDALLKADLGLTMAARIRGAIAASGHERGISAEELRELLAAEIAKVPGVTAVFAASGDLGNFSGYPQGSPDYERAINIVHDAAFNAGVRLCGPLAWRDRPDFTCFQAGSETAAIARGVAAELGPLANTQGKPEVGPYAMVAPKP